MKHPAPLLLALLLAQPRAPGMVPAAQDPLDQLNARFRQAYIQAKAASLARGGPVLMVAGDRLLLFRGSGQVAEAAIRPALYHRFKEVDHVALALYLLLAQDGAPPADLEVLRDLIRAARAGLKDWCPAQALDRQERILDACARLLDEGHRPAPERLAGFAAQLGPLLLANAEAAAALELDALDRQVARFRQDLGAASWKAAQVVILTSPLARREEVTLQYFSRLLGEPGEGGRIICSEGLWRPEEALDLLATHRVDGEAGAAFFGDPMRMHRDILADGARKWLDEHLPLR
jgi:hypothetical protein